MYKRQPFAFFVLTFLLAMLVLARSRRRIVVVGSIFVFFSGLIYFISMLALYFVFSLASAKGYLTYLIPIAGAVAILAGVINIKDYFFFKKGVSLTLPTSTAEKLPEKIKKLGEAKSTFALAVATAIFASTVNLYEMICTVGFPWVYNAMLKQAGLPDLTAVLYLLLYNVVYVLPLVCIVLFFVFTLGRKRFTKERVKFVKLISGFMILFMGIGLIYSVKSPEILLNPINVFLLIVAAVFLGCVIHLIKVALGKSGGAIDSG